MNITVDISSDAVNAVLCILSFVLAAFSLVFVILTIKQNNKMLESSSRPYITVCFESSQFNEPICYFVVRNFGASAGTIQSITYSKQIRDYKTSLADIPTLLDNLQGVTIAPGQKFFIPFKLSSLPIDVVTFDLSYTRAKKKYEEHVSIPLSSFRGYVKPRAANGTLKDVSYAVQEIAERLM